MGKVNVVLNVDKMNVDKNFHFVYQFSDVNLVVTNGVVT